MSDDRKEFTARERDEFEPGPCPLCGHAREKSDVVWQEVPPYSQQVQRVSLIERVDCPQCSRALAEEGDEWRDS